MCDQKFKFCENQPTDVNYPNLSDAEAGNDIKSVKKLSPLTAKKNSDKSEKKIDVICRQPNTCHSHSHCQPCPFDPSNNSETVNFKNQTSSVHFPPSFNLRSDKKSTPMKFSHNCTDSCFETSSTSSPKLSKTKSNKKPTQSETKVDIEIHKEDVSNETSFHSM